MQLASCEYLRQGASVLITGPAGVGKSHISTALGYQACLSGFRVRYFNMNKLLEAIQILSFSFLYTYNSCFSTLALAGRPLFLVIGLAFET